MNITLPTGRVLVRRLLWTTAVLHVLSLGSNVAYHGLGIHDLFPKFDWLANALNVDKEKSLPTWFSSIVLMLAACVLWEVSANAKATDDRYARHWRILSVIFAVLSIDEIAQFHEIASRSGIIKLGGTSYLSWMVPVIPLVIIFGVSYLRFVAQLPARTRWLIVTAGCIYIGGAVGVEIAGAFVGRDVAGHRMPGLPYLEYLVTASVEELMEMLGSITFLYAVASYLEQLRQPAPTARHRTPPLPGRRRAGDSAASPEGITVKAR